MPRPKTDPWYSDVIGALSGEYKGAALVSEVEKAARRVGRKDSPSTRTVSRLLAEWQKLPEAVRREAALFSWPKTMEMGLLQWSNSRAALDLLRFYSDHHGAMPTARPTVRVVKWFYRLRLASPGLPINIGVNMAQMLSAAEYARSVGVAGEVPDLDWLLAYEPWDKNNGEANAAALREAEQRFGLDSPVGLAYHSHSPEALEIIINEKMPPNEARTMLDFFAERMKEGSSDE